MSVQKAGRPFSADEFYRMAEAGILSEDDRVELVEGEVVKMSPTGSRHAACVDRLNKILNQQSGESAIVRVQSPIHLNDFSEPQPDVALLKPRDDFYSESHPTGADVLIVIEVADSSVVYDRAVKVALYARAGVPEFWLVDLVRNEIELYTQPENGAYKDVSRIIRGQELNSKQLPTLTLKADAILA